MHAFPKVYKSKKITKETNQNNNICVNMQPPENLKRTSIVGGPNSPTQAIRGLLEKILTSIVLYLKLYIKDDWDFLRKLPSHADYPCVLASCDDVSFYTSAPHDSGLEALSYWEKQPPEVFCKKRCS